MSFFRCLVPLALVISGLAFASSAEAASLGCFIDTPALDQPTPNQCVEIGFTNSTAVFRILGVSNLSSYDIHWFGGSCSGASCSFPISPGQTLNKAVRLTHKTNGSVISMRATARYIFEPPGF